MPKMSHVVEGWPRQTPLSYPSPVRTFPVRSSAVSPSAEVGLWKYRTIRTSRNALIGSVLVSAGFHALLLLGFNRHPPPVKHVFVDDGPIIQMTMPDLKDDEEKPVETLNEDQAVEDPGISVPSLIDLPTIVPINAFVQPLEFHPDVPKDLDTSKLASIPVNIARGSTSMEKLGKIFDVSQLDRQPQPVLQPAPIFPPELTKEYAESSVLMEFIITTKGEVVNPHAVRSEHRRFEEAAMRGVLKWKFRPGYKAGRPVNTRTQILIMFRVGTD